MLKIANSACIEAAPEVVWKALADLDKVSLWAEAIIEAHCPEADQGVGALRVCKLKGDKEIRERWVTWDEGRSFSYVAENVPMIESAINTWSVTTENGLSVLKSEVEFTFKGGLFGRLLEIPMSLLMKKMGPQSLAAFKYWVENGHPYEGNYSKLPIAPISC